MKITRPHCGQNAVSLGEAKTLNHRSGPRAAGKLELLSPAQSDHRHTRFKRFLAGAYREVQKEMKRRPKHVWPDDPANTAPTRRTKKYYP